jgi:hypothetical protein
VAVPSNHILSVFSSDKPAVAVVLVGLSSRVPFRHWRLPNWWGPARTPVCFHVRCHAQHPWVMLMLEFLGIFFDPWPIIKFWNSHDPFQKSVAACSMSYTTPMSYAHAGIFGHLLSLNSNPPLPHFASSLCSHVTLYSQAVFAFHSLEPTDILFRTWAVYMGSSGKFLFFNVGCLVFTHEHI